MQLIGRENNEGGIADPARPEHSFGGSLLTCIFGKGKPRKHQDAPSRRRRPGVVDLARFTGRVHGCGCAWQVSKMNSHLDADYGPRRAAYDFKELRARGVLRKMESLAPLRIHPRRSTPNRRAAGPP